MLHLYPLINKTVSPIFVHDLPRFIRVIVHHAVDHRAEHVLPEPLLIHPLTVHIMVSPLTRLLPGGEHPLLPIRFRKLIIVALDTDPIPRAP